MSRTTPPARPRTAPQLKAHHFKKGQSGNPLGRPKGQIDKVHRLQLQVAATGATPLEILLAIARKDEAPLAQLGIPRKDCTTPVRKSAAEAALPYVHRRMPIAVQTEVNGGISISPAAFAQLSDAALDHLIGEMQSAGLVPQLSNLIEGRATK